MGKSIREVYGTVLAELGGANENIVVLDADLSGSTKSGIFAKAHPERHFNMGIAESDMVATAAGLATTGKIPFVNTFTVFLTTLGLISARAQVCYGNLNVKFGGAYCGMSDALDGATHHATEDIAVMRALPNMTVLVPSDATSTRWATKYAVDTIVDKKSKDPEKFMKVFNRFSEIITLVFIVLFGVFYFQYLMKMAQRPQESASMHINMLIPMSTILIGVVLMVYHSVCRLFYSYETPAAAAEE